MRRKCRRGIWLGKERWGYRRREIEKWIWEEKREGNMGWEREKEIWEVKKREGEIVVKRE